MFYKFATQFILAGFSSQKHCSFGVVALMDVNLPAAVGV